jgi:hypothetical protein
VQGRVQGPPGAAQPGARGDMGHAVDDGEDPEQQREGVTAPRPGQANSTTPNATDTSPATMNIARVPAVSPLPTAPKISVTPATNAQMATTSTSTSAVGPGQTRATKPTARSARGEFCWGDVQPGGGRAGVQPPVPDGDDEIWVGEGQRAGQVHGVGAAQGVFAG